MSRSPRGEPAAPATTHAGNRDLFDSRCPAHDILGHLAGRWAVLVLHALAEDPRRYHELRRAIEGVSDKMLAATLRTLTGDGLVVRTVTEDTPPQVSYALSPLGRGAADAMAPLLTWIRVNAHAIERHRGRDVL